jgi:hypothetical protein
VIFILCLGPGLHGQTEKFLVPLYVHVTGAYGAVFATDIRIFNPGDQPVTVRGLEYPCVTLCPSPSYEVTIRPGKTGYGYQFLGEPGLVLEVPLDAGLSFGLRARDTSRDAVSAGTEVPIVPAAEFAPVVRLLGIRSDPLFRSMLRVYAFQSTQVVVRFLRETDGNLLEEQTLTLPAPVLETLPAYAQLFNLPADSTPFRVEVRALDDTAIWAFVSTTSNVTQEITLTTPQ